MEPITLFVQFDDLSDDTKYMISTFSVLFLICMVLMIVYVLLLITTLLYNLIKIERKTQYSRLHDTEIN
jgi:hypothetical protein